MRGVTTDISERKQAEDDLRRQKEILQRSERRLAEAQRLAHIGNWDWDLETDNLTWSDEHYRLFGLNPREAGISYEGLLERVHPADRELVIATVQQALETHQPFEYHLRIVRPDGEQRILHSRGNVIPNERGEPIRMFGTAQDVTELHQAEARLRESELQLRHAQKMEAVGQLAGGIAHDFNNLLTAVTGYSDLALRRLKAGDPLRHNIEEIRKAGERAAALTRQLLAFSRKQVLQPKVLDLNVVISDLEKMLRRLIGEDVELRTVFKPPLGNIKADPGQIEQVIMNLAVNARDAMPSGGRLSIETDNVNLDEAFARKHVGVAPGSYVLLSMSDTGTGMDEETQARIFEPFFTTKEVGKGTGLGLSMVYGIVKQSDGLILVHSTVDRGTTFNIYLPRVDGGAHEYRRTAETEQALEGSETILLAEDEEMVRSLARDVLEMYGYRVLEAANGGAAFLICERHPAPIHLLLTDVVMPEMGGRDLAERLSRLRPEMKVLYMSGYTDDAIVRHGLLDEGIAFLQKPFTPDTLSRKVRVLLDETGEPQVR